MPVDPDLQEVVDLVNSLGAVPPEELGVEGMRSSMDGLSLLFGAPRDDVVVDELEVPGRGGPNAWCRLAGATAWRSWRMRFASWKPDCPRSDKCVVGRSSCRSIKKTSLTSSASALST